MRAAMIIAALEAAGHPAWLVGGCVRDQFLGREPKDWDILTTAPAAVVTEVARSSGWATTGVGASFGITVVVIDGVPFEVAAARTEWYGDDCHRPAGVAFTGDITADLARRDFTINAMAQAVGGEVIDPFGGMRDLAEGIIRTVGDAVQRFNEDPLRVLRALRFHGRYGFRIHPEILAAIPAVLTRFAGLSVERVRDEIEKTLVAPRAASAIDLLVRTGLHKATCTSRESGISSQISLLGEIDHLVGLPQSPRYPKYFCTSDGNADREIALPLSRKVYQRCGPSSPLSGAIQQPTSILMLMASARFWPTLS